MDENQVQNEVRTFLVDTFPFVDEDFAFASDDSLVEAGIIDSMGVLELVEFLERQYGLAISDDELLPENLDTLERIGAFVVARTGSSAA